MKVTYMLALALSLSAAGASAADKGNGGDHKETDSKVADASHKAKSANDPDKVICRTEHETGSLLRVSRICHTRREWDQISQETGHDLERLDQSSKMGAGAANGF